MSHSQPHLVVIDDDPTGSQTVRDARIVLDLTSGLDDLPLEPGGMTFLLTNSRAMSTGDARAVNERIGVALADRAESFLLISRGDSTLRGHTVAETASLQVAFTAVGRPYEAVVFAPAFFEAGRRTTNGIHQALIDSAWTDVADTDYARDSTFGYRHSRLTDYLADQPDGPDAADVTHISLDDIHAGIDAVVDRMVSAVAGGWVVVDGQSPTDYQTVAAAVHRLHEQGHRLLLRTGPGMIAPLARIKANPPLNPGELPAPAGGRSHPLIVVGSHVGLTTQQVTRLSARHSLTEIEIEVGRIEEPGYLDTTARRTISALAESAVLLYTSRTMRTADTPAASLALSLRISAAVNDIVGQARAARPRYVIAKGGITSHEVAKHGLGIASGTVLGQLFPGTISVLLPEQAPTETLGMPYVIFPGNVGTPDSLADAVDRMEALTRPPV